jgi:hypothetical protein
MRSKEPAIYRGEMIRGVFMGENTSEGGCAEGIVSEAALESVPGVVDSSDSP